MIGRTVSHYRILSILGKGGMGIVYKAEDIRLGRLVAIKFAPENLSRDRQYAERFQREARAVSVLNHPNICVLHDIGEVDGYAFLVMECLEGQTLRERIGHKPMPIDELIDLAIQAADALDTAHARGIVHRDIKSGNLFLNNRGQIKVMDFGLAKLSRAPASANSELPTEAIEDVLTNPGATVGTVCYMSPEQARGEEMDARTDLFSFGVVLYEMATGVLPFEGNTTALTYVAILHEEPPAPTRLRPELPQELERIILKSLEKKRELRYQSAAEIRADLKRLRRDSDSSRPAAATEIRDAAAEAPQRGSRQSVAVAAAPPTGVGSSGEAVRAGRERKRLVAAALAVLGIGLPVAAYLAFRETPIDSLAVLPFEHAAADPGSEYLSDGISEGITNALSQAPKLSVRSFASAQALKRRGMAPEAAGKELGVRAVLTGRVVKRPGGFAVSAELIDVGQNRQIWGNQYAPTEENLQSIQEEISREVSQKLRLQLSGTALQRIGRQRAKDSAAYQLYLQGRFQWNKRTIEGLQESLEYFRQAIERDPEYALAYAGRADAYALLADFSVLPAKEVLPKLEQAAQDALRRDESLAEAHTSLGWARFHNWDWAGAEAQFKRAIELNDDYPTAHAWYGEYLMATGRFDQAQREMSRALELNPVSPGLKLGLGYRFYYARQYAEAIDQIQKILAEDPSFVPAHVYLGRAWQQTGRHAEATAEFRKGLELSQGDTNELAFLGQAYAAGGQAAAARGVLEQLRERSRQTYVQPVATALIHAMLGERDAAFGELQKAYADRSTGLVYLKVDPAWDGIRNDPRFRDLVGRVGIR